MSRQRSERKSYDFLLPLEVRWGDMDALGHVNNACYFTYSESARIAFFDQLFADQADFMNGQGPILAKIACEFHEQLHYPAAIEVGVGVRKVGRSSLELLSPVFRQGENIAVADIQATVVWFDYRQQTTMSVPERLRDLVMPQLA